jgi:hypothetical protein
VLDEDLTRVAEDVAVGRGVVRLDVDVAALVVDQVADDDP